MSNRSRASLALLLTIASFLYYDSDGVSSKGRRGPMSLLSLPLTWLTYYVVVAAIEALMAWFKLHFYRGQSGR